MRLSLAACAISISDNMGVSPKNKRQKTIEIFRDRSRWNPTHSNLGELKTDRSLVIGNETKVCGRFPKVDQLSMPEKKGK
jgi:hypothetical protein